LCPDRNACTIRAMIEVLLLPGRISLKVERGARLADALRDAGMLLDYPCGGRGTCGQCRVFVDPPPDSGRGGLPEKETERGVRLACLLTLDGDCTVTIPDERFSRRTWTGDVRRRDIDVETARLPGFHAARARRGGALGLAVDLGTTTVDMALLDLETGARIARGTLRNAQAAFGADVISRAKAFHEDPGPVREAALSSIRNGAAALLSEAGTAESMIRKTVVVGNPIMIHILAGIDPWQLTQYPFTPVTTAAIHGAPRDFSFDFQREGEVHTLPLISSYVGADTVGVIVSLGLEECRGTYLAADIGTNGEIVLARDGRLAATSTAAGPAFEGAEISRGMRAAEGAVYGVSISEDGSVDTLVIGGGSPKGLCGTGLVTAVSQMLDRGIIDPSGRLAAPGADLPGGLAERVREDGGERAFVISREGDVLVTQADVRKLQLAKAAVRTGIETLLEVSGVTAEDLDGVRLAGGFGAGLDSAAAARIGLVPAFDPVKVSSVGNAALRGAVLALLSPVFMDKAESAAKNARFIELGGRAEFQTRFVEAMGF
jgi:uncharacterized 2Fe-2S/4Fe-4S cluster protein (DUF4445 family)